MFFTLNYNIPEWSSGFSSPFFLLQFSTLRNFLKILDPQKSKTWDFFAAKTFEIPNLMKKKFMRNIRTSTQNPKLAHLYVSMWWWFSSIWWAIFKIKMLFGNLRLSWFHWYDEICHIIERFFHNIHLNFGSENLDYDKNLSLL